MMFKNSSLKILLMVSLFMCLLPSARAQRNGDKYPFTKFKHITEVASDTFRIKIVVADIYYCPPCPEGAQCKPCIGDHIVVKERKSSTETLRVFTHDPGLFVKGKNYVLTVRSRINIKDRRKEFLELVAYQKSEN